MTKHDFTQKKRGRQSNIKVGYEFTSKEGYKCRVVHYQDKDNVTVEIQDNHKCKVTTYASSIRRGIIRNPYHPTVFGVGYLGEGDAVITINDKRSPEYAMWQDMLRRCYDPKYQERNKTYVGCTVHPDWLNFQVFVKWLVNNEYYGLGYELDKDIVKRGNKCYCPKYCRLVPKEINTMVFEKREGSGNLPLGVCKRRNTYKASIRMLGKKYHLGTFPTPIEASNAYLTAKSGIFRFMASKWMGKVDKDVIDVILRRAAEYAKA